MVGPGDKRKKGREREREQEKEREKEEREKLASKAEIVHAGNTETVLPERSECGLGTGSGKDSLGLLNLYHSENLHNLTSWLLRKIKFCPWLGALHSSGQNAYLTDGIQSIEGLVTTKWRQGQDHSP